MILLVLLLIPNTISVPFPALKADTMLTAKKKRYPTKIKMAVCSSEFSLLLYTSDDVAWPMTSLPKFCAAGCATQSRLEHSAAS